MSALVNSSYNALPIQLKVEILQLLETCKSARLVCTYWFRLLGLIRPPGFQLFDNQSEPLQILKESFLHSIEILQVGGCTETLPICTSTRCGIPRTKILQLCHGISVENIMKLLRNYARCCKQLVLNPYCFENLVEPFRLKGLAYESLRSLKICCQIPTHDLEHFEERSHLIALTQLFKTTKLPNLQEFDASCFGRLSDENSTIQKFNEALISFFKRHGQQLTKLKYFYIIPSVLVNSFNNLCNLEELWILFDHNAPINNLNETQESFKHIKKLKSLKCSDHYESAAFQNHSEFIATMLRENRGIQKFTLHGYLTRMDWIPVGCELQKEIELKFQRFDTNLFTRTTNANQKLNSVTKLHLNDVDRDWMPQPPQLCRWIIATLPNLKNLSWACPIGLKLSYCRFLIWNLIHLKVFNINDHRVADVVRDWFIQQNDIGFIKSISTDTGLKILINRPLPYNIFD